ncbi:hypothetical protein T440DRAFT_470442 [Plenodomus tracheiphilus IPT5]|uniref:C2H2-type domain-containing protein n=1 Tax=Plenodomus tracheiphilus IPT5 TaxID=1408161 RepID=A0A6A7AXX2_9PLEO|nr:hypothetical protein T440DRAFT_470442 [Plenodomus tracheiphilus IPT5]
MAVQLQQRRRTSLLLTFKVLQFVNQLRRRVKPRVSQGTLDETDLGTDTALGLKKLRSISNGLAKISVEDAKPPRRVAHPHRVSKTAPKAPKSVRRLCSANAAATLVSTTPNAPGHDAQHLLSAVDRKLSRKGYSFSAVAGDDRLLLKHRNAPIFERCSLTELIQLLAAVQDALHVLAECRQRFGDDWLVAQGIDVGLCIDESFIANYEHMLVRLRTDLIDAMARTAFQELLQGGHDKQKRKLLGWFTEFAEKPQALSTSFPWTIKPSLAVLWGVCWMFYDNNAGAPAAKGGSNRVPLDKVLQSIKLDQWDAPASSDYLDLGRQLIGTPPQQAAQHHARQQTASTAHVGLEHDLFQARNTGDVQSDLSPLDSRLPRLDVSQADGLGPSPVRIHPPHPSRDTYYRGAQLELATYLPVNFYLPHNQGTIPAAPLTAFPHLGTTDNSNSWHPYHSLPQDTSRRHLVASTPNPRIRVTGTAGSDVYAQPHTDLAAFDNIYHPGHQPEAYSLNLDPSYTFDPSQYIMSESSISPATSTTAMQIPQILVKHERTSSINSINGMPTPVSTSGPRSPLTPTADAQPHILTSPQSHSRQISEDRSSLSGDDERKINYTYKRNEEPERNSEGKMMCKHQDCSGLIFERKCEWSKHMDKHDRPYKCLVPGCEKLQGFTYSGGLLRHEREVHKLHGGTKKSLFCPFSDCKRSSGTGFTRKENLAEHVRRVHRRTSMSADMHGLIIRRDTGMTMEGLTERREASESPYARPLEYREDDEMMSAKRKRSSDFGGSREGGAGTEELRSEIKRLRLENEEKDERLRQLEQAVMALQQGRR